MLRFPGDPLDALVSCGFDVERELPKLSTYVGHVRVNLPIGYLEAVPELLQLATNRLMQRQVQP